MSCFAFLGEVSSRPRLVQMDTFHVGPFNETTGA
jgi:hypothetical protein